jgi:uncharacterized protein
MFYNIIVKIKKIKEIHKKYAQDEKILNIVWQHSVDVCDLALTIADNLKKKGIEINKNLIKEGALLHDIGVYLVKKDKNYWKHGEKGYLICKKEKLDNSIARICQTHVGVGIGDNIPISLEEEIVSYADQFYSKFPPRKEKLAKIRKEVVKYGKNNLAIFDRWHKKFNID